MTAQVRDLSAFQVPDYLRSRWIEETQFFFDQANKRLLTQFADDTLEADAKSYSEAAYEKMGQRFDPDIHDPASDAEDAFHEGVEHYRLLSQMKKDVRLSMISTMYHIWEKELRDWLVQEVRYWAGRPVGDVIWEQPIDYIFNLLKDAGYVDVRKENYFKALDALRLVVNVFKHGDGKSLKDLDKKYPNFTATANAGLFSKNLRMRVLKHEHMDVTDAHFDEFRGALISFWKSLPANMMVSEIKSLPKWFRDAANLK